MKLATFLYDGSFYVLVRNGVSLDHVDSSLLRPVSKGNSVQIKEGFAFIKGPEILIINENVDLKFGFHEIEKIHSFKKEHIWKNRTPLNV